MTPEDQAGDPDILHSHDADLTADGLQLDGAHLGMAGPMHLELGDYFHQGIIGTPFADARFLHPMIEPFTCAVQSQAGILHEYTGEVLTEGYAAVEAAQHGWLTVDGMDPDYVGRSLQLHGVACHPVHNGTVGDVIQELSFGHKVILGVNSQALSDPHNPLQQFHSQAANHAIWVTGVDLRDPDHPKVIVNDSARPDGAANTYEMSDFVNAWQHSGYDYVATDYAPPHLEDRVDGFDPQQGMFTGLVDYLKDHIPEFAMVGAAAAGTALLGTAVLHKKERAAPSSDTVALPRNATPPSLPAPDSPLTLFPSSLATVSPEERDRLLLKL